MQHVKHFELVGVDQNYLRLHLLLTKHSRKNEFSTLLNKKKNILCWCFYTYSNHIISNITKIFESRT